MFTLLLFALTFLLGYNHAFTFAPGSSRLIWKQSQESRLLVPLNLPFAPKAEYHHHLATVTRTRQVVFSSWGPEPEWESCTVVKSRVASKQCVEITVEVSSEKAQQYKLPGQYLQIRPANDQGTKPVFLAVASPPAKAPDDSKFEFLVKRSSGNGFICDAAVGTKLDVSQILGQGFPMQENLDGFKYDFPTQNVILCASGSGKDCCV
jgi:hypothetical protein